MPLHRRHRYIVVFWTGEPGGTGIGGGRGPRPAPLLCLDDLGYVQLDAQGSDLLFQILTERQEKAPVAVASSFALEERGRSSLIELQLQWRSVTRASWGGDGGRGSGIARL